MHKSLISATSMSSIQSPSVQVMERQGGFDPNRIPASVFDKPQNSMDWSAGSNDSLFSIRLGKDRSPRNHASKMSVDDLQRLGEFDELFDTAGGIRNFREPEELNNKSADQKMSNEMTRPKPTTKGVQPSRNNVDMTTKNMGKEVNPRATRTMDKPVVHDVSQAHIAGKNTGAKKKKSACPLCHCSDCSQAFNCCKWPGSSCCKWPSCSCKSLSCSLCSGCKWLRWPSCSMKWPSCCCKPANCCSCKWSNCSCKCLNSCPSCDCKCFAWLSCNCKCPAWSSCNFKCSTLSSCCCKCPASLLSCCSCKCPSLSSCCSCKCPTLSSCCCKWPTFSSGCCKWPSCSCKLPSFPSCKCLTQPSCKCKCPTWSGCCS